jgi:ATP-dependent Clp protease ATP-binding subunit ClpA
MLGTGPSGSVPFSPGAKRTLELALGEALDRGHADIGTAHVLLALLSDDTKTAAAVALGDVGCDHQLLRWRVNKALAAGASDEAS